MLGSVIRNNIQSLFSAEATLVVLCILYQSWLLQEFTELPQDLFTSYTESGLLPSATTRKGINSVSAATELGASLRCIKGGDAGQKKIIFLPFFFPAVLLFFLPEDLNAHEYNGLAFWNASKNGAG